MQLRMMRVDEHVASQKELCVLRLKPVVRAQNANHAKFVRQLLARFGPDVSMELQTSKISNRRSLAHFIYGSLDKNAHRANPGHYGFDNFACNLWFNVARAFAAEVEPDHVHAEIRALFRVIDAGDAADFDLHPIHFHGDATGKRLQFSISSRNAASGSPASIKVSPIKKPRNPRARRWRSCSALCNPLSLIITASLGASAMMRSLARVETSNVRRSRLFTPISLAPALSARRNSSEVCTSSSASSCSSSSAIARMSSRAESSRMAAIKRTASAPAMAAS